MILAYFSFTNQADQWLADVTGALHHVKFEEVSATSLAVKRQYVAEPNGFDGWSGLSPLRSVIFRGYRGYPLVNKQTKSYWTWAFIVDLAMNLMVIFHSYVNVYQRVYTV